MDKNVKRLSVLLMFCLQFSFAYTQDYVRVVARPGENVKSLLMWYNLHEYDCNTQQFYELNDLKADAKLSANTVYTLPLRLYRYNGKSIRTTIDDADINKALRIKAYNEDMEKRGLMMKNFVKTRNLWVPIHELKCPGNKPVITQIPEVSPTQTPEVMPSEKPKPTTPKTPEITPPPSTETPVVTTAPEKKYAIFGKNNPVEIKSNKLQGAVYYIVAGHGGPDTGAIGSRSGKSLCEDEYAYDVSLRLAKNLLENGATVYMITRDTDGIREGEYLPCDYDEVCWPNRKIPRGQKSRLNQRAGAINVLYDEHKAKRAKVQRALMIHIDSRSKSHQTDLFFYHHPLSRNGKSTANVLQKTIKAQYKKHQPNRGYSGTVTGRDLHMLRETKPTAVYIELGNIRHSLDQQRFVKAANRQAIANWLLDGLYADYKKAR